MLLALRIENFALIDTLDLELGTGLTVLTGETGAGKSIILDALDAVLGGKMPGRAVRTGETRSHLEGTFAMTPVLADWLTDHDIDPLEDGSLICSRELTLTGGTPRSRSRVNGVLVNRAQMESLRERLVEITAQGQTVQLGQSNRQRDWLDSFGGSELWQARDRTARAHATYLQTQAALERRRLAENQRLQQMDLWEYQAKELAKAELGDPEELEQLEAEYQRLAHSVDLQRQSYQVYQLLYQNDQGGYAVADLLGEADHILQGMQGLDPDLQPLVDQVNEAIAQVQEAGRQIHIYGSSLEADPARLAELEDRITILKRICKKYGPTLAEAIAHAENVQRELALFTDGGQSLEALEAAHAAAERHLIDHCTQLTQLRRHTAQRLEAELVAELKPLAMERVQFAVALNPTPPSAHGADQVCFLFSPNPGEPLQPLSETASGGEMSRFLLALKACFSQVDPVGTLVFDEIDAGVSGRVSQAIATKLQQLSRAHQVLCVTHQPLIAAIADQHLQVTKQVVAEGMDHNLEQNRTVIRVQALDTHTLRRQELAELTGGKSAQEALTFAESLLTQAAQGRLIRMEAAERHEQIPASPSTTTKTTTKVTATTTPQTTPQATPQVQPAPPSSAAAPAPKSTRRKTTKKAS